MERLSITKKQVRLLAQKNRIVSFITYKTRKGWLLIVELRDQKVEIQTERGPLRAFKQLSSVAQFIEEAVPTAKELKVLLAGNDEIP